MPRISRAIAVGYPHHVTQRGNYRQIVFAEMNDYARYLELLAEFAPRYGLEIWAYCLMPNHVHFVGVPTRQESLARTFNTLHMQHAQYFNRKQNTAGHLWQGRFFSCILDERHLYAAVRYVELNPVRAGIVSVPQDYPWCSAKCRVTGIEDPVLSGNCFLTETVQDWEQYLREDRDREATADIIQATKIGRPCGREDFIKGMEELLNRRFRALPRGRPWKKKAEENK